MADYRQTIQKVEDTLNDASRKLANKNSKAALALGEINTIQYLDIQKIIKGIEKYDVLVGIPDATTQRRRGEVTNAELAYLHTHGVTKASERQKIEEYITQGFDYKDARKKVHDLHMLTKGSPAWSIPPRPIIEPAIEDSKEEISKLMQNALRSFLELDLLNAAVVGLEKQQVTDNKEVEGDIVEHIVADNNTEEEKSIERSENKNKLPKTGGVSAITIGLIGNAILASGIFILRKKDFFPVFRYNKGSNAKKEVSP